MHRDPGLSKYRFPVVRSAFPAPEKWRPYLEESYAQNLFTNFGPAANRFETALTGQFGEKNDAFIAVSSATAGLAACLIAEQVSGIVLVPAFTFPATTAAVRMAGAEPMLVDVDPVTWACDAQKRGRRSTAPAPRR
jgi:dTDP-4-amino-4,6-dideoxygalactose transaminase